MADYATALRRSVASHNAGNSLGLFLKDFRKRNNLNNVVLVYDDKNRLMFKYYNKNAERVEYKCHPHFKKIPLRK